MKTTSIAVACGGVSSAELVTPKITGAAARARACGSTAAAQCTTSCSESSKVPRVPTIHVVPGFSAVTLAARIPTGDDAGDRWIANREGRDRRARGGVRRGTRERVDPFVQRVKAIHPYGPDVAGRNRVARVSVRAAELNAGNRAESGRPPSKRCGGIVWS